MLYDIGRQKAAYTENLLTPSSPSDAAGNNRPPEMGEITENFRRSSMVLNTDGRRELQITATGSLKMKLTKPK